MKRSCWQTRPNGNEKKPRRGVCPPPYVVFEGTSFSSKLCAVPHVLEQIRTLLLSPEEAIVEAAMTKQLGWLRSLIEQYEIHSSDALLVAARNRDVESMEMILPNMYYPDSNEMKDGACAVFEKAVVDAARNGHLDTVRLLLPKLDYVDENRDAAWAVINVAAARGHLDILSFAADTADSGGEPTDDTSGALLRAISCGKSAAAIFLVSRYYRIWDLSKGLEEAVVNRMDAVADCIYGASLKPDNGTSFSDFFVLLVAGNGYMNALNYLYHRGHNEPSLLGFAFGGAAFSEAINVLRMLLNTGRLSQDTIDQALRKAARSGCKKSVEFLFGNCRISTQAIKNAFEDAGSITLSKYLYKKLVDPAESVRTAFQNAACCGRYTFLDNRDRIDILQFLCSTGFVPDKLICEVFIATIGNWFAGIVVLALCNEACISAEVTHEAFQRAAGVGSTEVAKLLLSKHNISLSAKEEAMMSAARNGRRDVLKEICASEDWSLEVLDKASTETSDASSLAILQAKKVAKLKSSMETSAKC
ncbi:hypothetical protein PHYPSEUDO_012951 [Phytophthora pseudosyringae]|uniref:Ankyrin repeat protein n=1 Tax=Phytophthora pseudosyringae TaxID=221518 RepID=A0A8T1V6R5_9STRA|nr:hypothetical protein PHYPSEUDO_012951 [Phytophthora pseudosyringae]